MFFQPHRYDLHCETDDDLGTTILCAKKREVE